MSAHGGGGLPFLATVEDTLHRLHEKQGVHIPIYPIIGLFALAVVVFLVFEPGQTSRNFELVLFLSPAWLPLLIGRVAWQQWVKTRRYEYNVNQKHVLLELRIPRETRKSPLAMETFLTNIHLTPGEGTWYKKWWQGRTRPWFSLELVSIGGRVHFYIWTRKEFQHVIETYLYAQYPGIEVIEAADYTRLIDPLHPPYLMWGCEYKKKAPDPFPINTYVTFGLDKMPQAKPEEVTDPIANVIEFMGSLSPQEQLWVHIMIRYSKGEKYGKYKDDGKRYTWKDEAKELIEKIRKETMRKMTYVDPVSGDLKESEGFPNPTKGQMEGIAAVERNVDKLCYDVGMRAVYVSQEGHFRPYIGNFVTQLFRPFSSSDQQIEPNSMLWSESFNDFPWEDPNKVHYNHLMHELLEYARRRAYFHYPYEGPYMQMSTEELASIYHIPSSTVSAPNLPRIQSSTRESPSNLPT